VQSLDVFPTILKLAGVPHAAPPGATLLPLDDEGTGRAFTFVEFGRPTEVLKMVQREWPMADVSVWDRSIKAIRGPRFKYIYYSDGQRELYDLAADPDELVNLAEQHPEVLEQLEGLLLSFHDGRQDMIWPAEEMEPERLEALRSLGYVP
jgi:arylsulfatase A-like enzyme